MRLKSTALGPNDGAHRVPGTGDHRQRRNQMGLEGGPDPAHRADRRRLARHGNPEAAKHGRVVEVARLRGIDGRLAEGVAVPGAEEIRLTLPGEGEMLPRSIRIRNGQDLASPHVLEGERECHRALVVLLVEPARVQLGAVAGESEVSASELELERAGAALLREARRSSEPGPARPPPRSPVPRWRRPCGSRARFAVGSARAGLRSGFSSWPASTVHARRPAPTARPLPAPSVGLLDRPQRTALEPCSGSRCGGPSSREPAFRERRRRRRCRRLRPCRHSTSPGRAVRDMAGRRPRSESQGRA